MTNKELEHHRLSVEDESREACQSVADLLLRPEITQDQFFSEVLSLLSAQQSALIGMYREVAALRRHALDET